WDMGLLRPDLARSPTPFLDLLATSPQGAYWTRHTSFGPPSLNGLMASHCSLTPHSRRFMTTTFTYVDLVCLPEVLRRHGYAAEIYNGGDADWDNSSYWMRQWYDQVRIYHNEAKELDREVFRLAAENIRRLGAQGRPFLATVVSVSNHFPFPTREPALDIAG